MKGIMKIELMSYLKQLQEIQTFLANEGKASHVSMNFDEKDELYSLDFSIYGEPYDRVTLYVWCPKYWRKEDEIDNERKLAYLRNKYVKKALTVVA